MAGPPVTYRTVSVASDDSTLFGAPTDIINATYAQEAVEVARALIQPVPGEGPIRGVWVFDGDVYAFRDRVGGVYGDIYKSSTTGWQQVEVGQRINYTTADQDLSMTYGLASYCQIEGDSSSATANVQRQIITSGTISGGDAAGFFIVTDVSGDFVDAETLTVTFISGGPPTTASTTIVVDEQVFGVVEDQNLLAGGIYSFCNKNFYGSNGYQAMYVANGVNRAMEIRNNCVAMIDAMGTGGETSAQRSLDKPTMVAAHRGRLFLALIGGTMDCSIAGNPQSFSGLLGAAEFGMGAEITGMVGEVSDTLWVFTTEQIAVLYGSSPDLSSADPFILKTLNAEAGAELGTVQRLGTITYKDREGVRTTQETQTFGNFSIGTLTRAIVPLLKLKKSRGVVVAGSLRCRHKSQYRLLFSDGTGISIYLGKTKVVYGQETSVPVITAFDLGFTPYGMCSGVIGDDAAIVEDDPNSGSYDSLPGDPSVGVGANAKEAMFVGNVDGYVIQLDAGYSADGDDLISYARFAFDTCRAPSTEKRYMQLTFEMSKEFWRGDTAPSASFSIGAEFNYSDPFNTPSSESAYTVNTLDFTQAGSGGYWDEMTWEDFIWDSPVVGRPSAAIDGLGRNISPSIRTVATYEPPHTIHSYELQFSPRKMAVG